MKLVCSTCLAVLEEGGELGPAPVSHTMCAVCLEHFLQQWDGLSLSEQLDGFEAPCLILDGEGRVVAANQQLLGESGGNREELLGLLSGEALECQSSKRPGGCGRTVHCRTCTIRHAIRVVHETGEPCMRLPAYLNTDRGRLYMSVSALQLGGAIRVLLEAQEAPFWVA